MEEEDDGFVIDRFRIIRRLGAGGMGVVFEAEDRELGSRVALKSLRTLSAEAVWRFKTEFRALADLRHPNLVTLGELFEEGGQWFFTMEMIEGLHFLAYVRPGEYSKGRKIKAKAVAPAPSSESAPTLDLDSKGGPAAPMELGVSARTTLTPEIVEGYDEVRLRSAIRQLAQGLHALHLAEKVHCDVKPSNVLVTPEGRVAILDFGLVTDLTRQEGAEHLAGTVSYMAPEQAALQPLGPEADWYSVGVVLFQALTGQLPLRGSPRELLALKQVVEPPPPHAFVPDVPADLDRLCVELLRIDPHTRPRGEEILRRLDVQETPREVGGGERTQAFVGRRREMQALREAFEQTRKGRGVAVFIDGESGVGKTALTRRFTSNLEALAPDALLFSGRCHERESVPYKAVDGIIDALSRYLKRESADSRLISPSDRGLLGQVFPVMRRVETIARAPRQELSSLDPHALRKRVFSALRTLFSRLAERTPLVLTIDDLQWADADSLSLLGEVIRAPNEPKLLLVATVRAASEQDAGFRSVQQLAAIVSGDVRTLHLGPLPEGDARALATTLLQTIGATSDARAAAIAEEAGGHPLFIDELVRLGGAQAGMKGGVLLDDVLWTRIEHLEGPARELIKIVALAGVPLPQETAASAAGIELSVLEQRVQALRSENLVRTHGGRRHDTVEPYHDRVREAVLQRLDPNEKRSLHGRIAVALEASERADPESLCIHWHGAGEPKRAAEEAERAALQSVEALAFDRAARLYQLALELRPREGPEGVRLRARLGDALANAGRGRDAADAYLAAATEATVAEALELRRYAAEQLLRSGHIDEAMETFSVVLAAIGMDMPKTPRGALTALVVRRAQVRLRGLRFKRHEESQIAPEVLQRIDTCWSVAAGLGLVDTVRGAYFQSRGLLLALDAGEPRRVARALAVEASYSSASGGHTQDRTASLRDAADALAREMNDPYTSGWTVGAAGITASLEGRWRAGHECCEQAEAIFRDHCTGVAWEVASMRWFSLWSQSYLGKLADLTERVPERLHEAEERGDLYAAMCHSSGLANLVWLADDEPDEARERLQRAMERWSQRTFHVEHWWEMLAEAQIDLYAGSAQTALQKVKERWTSLDDSLLLRVQLTNLEALHLRARCSLAAASQIKSEAKALLHATEKDASGIEREKMPWSTPLATLLRAGVAAQRGERDDAIALLKTSAHGLEEAHMLLYATAARHRLGRAMGGDEGRALEQEADRWLALQGVQNVGRMLAMLAPGLD